MGAVTRLHTHTLAYTYTHSAFSALVAAAATEDDHIWPWDSHGKRRAGLRKRGEKCRRDCNCMFHLGFRSAAKTIAPLESQISFHVRGPKARGGTEGGEAERSESHGERDGRIQPLLIFPYNRSLMWRLLYGGQ